MQSILLMNGPNLNLLGQRNPAAYGSLTLAELEARLTGEATRLGVTLSCFQSNQEEALARRLLAAETGAQGIILNAGAYTHTGQALAEAVARSPLPVVEVHLSNVFARESFRHVSLLSPHCIGSICGLGYGSYVAALRALLGLETQAAEAYSPSS